MSDNYQAVSNCADIQTSKTGPLAGLRLLVKEMLDVRGLPTTAGHPSYAAWRGEVEAHAAPVARLLKAGARLVGKTHTHELAWGLTGINPYYGTPLNPLDPARIPGGSSSGSAVAAAAGLAELALGTDTAGSIRLPASLCGVWGLRPTWGLVDGQGAVPLAPSLDTIGLLCAEAGFLALGMGALLPRQKTREFKTVLLPMNDGDLLSHEAQAARLRLLTVLQGLGLEVQALTMPDMAWAAEIMRVIQGAEVLNSHQRWWSEQDVRLGEDVAGLRALASKFTVPQIGAAISNRHAYTRQLRAMLPEGALLLLASAPNVAPTLLEMQHPDTALDFRRKVLRLVAPASLAGLPALACPVFLKNGLSIGMQLMAGAGQDRSLLKLALAIAQSGRIYVD